MTSSVNLSTSPSKRCSYMSEPATLNTSSLTLSSSARLVARHPERDAVGRWVGIANTCHATASDEATTKWVVATALLFVTSHTLSSNS